MERKYRSFKHHPDGLSTTLSTSTPHCYFCGMIQIATEEGYASKRKSSRKYIRSANDLPRPWICCCNMCNPILATCCCTCCAPTLQSFGWKYILPCDIHEDGFANDSCVCCTTVGWVLVQEENLPYTAWNCCGSIQLSVPINAEFNNAYQNKCLDLTLCCVWCHAVEINKMEETSSSSSYSSSESYY